MNTSQVPLVERSGRRPLLLGGMTGMAVSAVVITVALVLQSTVPWMAYISIVCMITFVIGFAIGLGSPTFLILSRTSNSSLADSEEMIIVCPRRKSVIWSHFSLSFLSLSIGESYLKCAL